MSNKRTFEQWKALVDATLQSILGLTSDDLPDWDYATAYAEGVSPVIAARRAYRNAQEF